MEQAIRGRGDSRLRDLAMMTEFAHTGPNEALNALRNKASKFVRFYYGCVLMEGGSMGHLLILMKLINTARQCCGSGIRNRFFPDLGSQDHIFKSFWTIFLVKSSIIL